MSRVDPSHETDEALGKSSATPTSYSGVPATIDSQLPALTSQGWNYGPPPKPEILTAKANPVELMHALRRRWPLALGLGLTTGSLLAALVWFLLPVKYEVYSLLRVQGRQPGVLNRGAEGIDQFQVFKRTQVQLILSPMVLKRTVAETVGGLSTLATIREQEDPSNWLKNQLIIDYPDDSEIMRVALKGKRSGDLVKIVNGVVQKYLTEVVYREKQDRLEQEGKLARSYEEYTKDLEKQMGVLHKMEQVAKVASTESALVIKKIAADRLQATVGMRDLFSREKADIEARIAIAEAREENPDVGSAADFIIDQELNRDPAVFLLQQKLADLFEAESVWRQRVANPNNSKRIRQIQHQVAELQDRLDQTKAELRPKLIEAKIAEEEKKASSKDQTYSLPVLQRHLKHINDKLSEAEKKIDDDAAAVMNLESFSATVASKQEELKRLRSVISELGTELERLRVERNALDRIKLIDPAIVDTNDAIRKYVSVVFSFLVGSGLVVFGIAFMEFNRRRVISVSQVNDGLGIKVIGELPSVTGRAWRRIKGGKGNAVLKALMAERIDGTRTTLIHTNAVSPPRVVMVTSAEPREGKTTTATQLAASLARSGRRTVLVDGDIRNPGAHRVVDLPLEPGLAELLRGEAERDSVVHPTRTPNLWLLPAGRCDLKSVQALSNSFVGGAISALCGQFDYVIIDAGPVLKVADPLMLGQHADVAIISVRRDISQIPKVYEACERLRSVGVTVLGAVVNGVNDDVARHGVELLMAETT